MHKAAQCYSLIFQYMACCLGRAGFVPVNTVSLCRISFISKGCCQQSYTYFASCAKIKAYKKVCHHNNEIPKQYLAKQQKSVKGGKRKKKKKKKKPNQPSFCCFPPDCCAGAGVWAFICSFFSNSFCFCPSSSSSLLLFSSTAAVISCCMLDISPRISCSARSVLATSTWVGKPLCQETGSNTASVFCATVCRPTARATRLWSTGLQILWEPTTHFILSGENLSLLYLYMTLVTTFVSDVSPRLDCTRSWTTKLSNTCWQVAGNPNAKPRQLPLQKASCDKLEQRISLITVFCFSQFVFHLYTEKKISRKPNYCKKASGHRRTIMCSVF